jgi:hypothetical protein
VNRPAPAGSAFHATWYVGIAGPLTHSSKSQSIGTPAWRSTIARKSSVAAVSPRYALQKSRIISMKRPSPKYSVLCLRIACRYHSPEKGASPSLRDQQRVDLGASRIGKGQYGFRDGVIKRRCAIPSLQLRLRGRNRRTWGEATLPAKHGDRADWAGRPEGRSAKRTRYQRDMGPSDQGACGRFPSGHAPPTVTCLQSTWSGSHVRRQIDLATRRGAYATVTFS